MVRALVIAALVLSTGTAFAVPVKATFSGQVTGSSTFPDVLADFPVGTAASFELNFDDDILVPNAPPPSFVLAGVSGWLKLGSTQWTVTAGNIYSYSFLPDPFPVVSYTPQFTGTGPTISGGASFFGLFTTLAMPALLPANPTALLAGFGYPVDNGTYYSYAVLQGDYSIARTSVPEPGSLALLMTGLGAFAALRRRRRALTNPAPSIAR